MEWVLFKVLFCPGIHPPVLLVKEKYGAKMKDVRCWRTRIRLRQNETDLKQAEHTMIRWTEEAVTLIVSVSVLIIDAMNSEE